MPVLYLICVTLQAVLRIARLHDDLLSAKDPVLTLRVAAAFCTLAVLSNIFRCQHPNHSTMQKYAHASSMNAQTEMKGMAYTIHACP